MQLIGGGGGGREGESLQHIKAMGYIQVKLAATVMLTTPTVFKKQQVSIIVLTCLKISQVRDALN